MNDRGQLKFARAVYAPVFPISGLWRPPVLWAPKPAIPHVAISKPEAPLLGCLSQSPGWLRQPPCPDGSHQLCCRPSWGCPIPSWTPFPNTAGHVPKAPGTTFPSHFALSRGHLSQVTESRVPRNFVLRFLSPQQPLLAWWQQLARRSSPKGVSAVEKAKLMLLRGQMMV